VHLRERRVQLRSRGVGGARERGSLGRQGPRDIICAVLKGLRPTIPADAPADIAEIARRCWCGVPGERPPFKEIMEGIRATGET